MKNRLVFVLSLCLVLTFTTCSLAAHNTSDFEWDTDSWYNIDEVYKYIELGGGIYEGEYEKLYFKYFLNEQTFFLIDYDDWYKYETVFAGSYLFNNGFFFSAAYNENHYIWFSPGYRFDLADGKSFVAVSVDYVNFDNDYYRDYNKENEDINETLDDLFTLEINSKFFIGNARIIANLWLPEDNDVEDTKYTKYYLGANFLVNDALVIGADLYGKNSELDFSMGMTWKPAPLVIDACAGIDYDDDYYFYLSCMYRWNENYSFGVGVDKYQDWDAEYYLKFKYATDKNAIAAYYTIENEYLKDYCFWLNSTWYFD